MTALPSLRAQRGNPPLRFAMMDRHGLRPRDDEARRRSRDNRNGAMNDAKINRVLPPSRQDALLTIKSGRSPGNTYATSYQKSSDCRRHLAVLAACLLRRQAAVMKRFQDLSFCSTGRPPGPGRRTGSQVFNFHPVRKIHHTAPRHRARKPRIAITLMPTLTSATP